MKKILNKIVIPFVFIFSATNIQAETTIQFSGEFSGVWGDFVQTREMPAPLEENFTGTVTFDENNILTASVVDNINAFSSLSIINKSLPPITVTGTNSNTGAADFLPILISNRQRREVPLLFDNSLSEVWIEDIKLTQENLTSITPHISSLLSASPVNIRLVFTFDTTRIATVTGKINSIAVIPNPSAEPPVCDAGADPQKIKQGEGTALWWWTDKALAASIDNDIGFVTIPTDYSWIYPAETTTYTMTTLSENGTQTSCSTTVIVEGQAAPICEMGADPQVINAGEGTALWWWSNSASSASIDNNIGTVTVPTDFTWFYPAQTTTYTMKAVGANGETTQCNTTITVQ